MRGPSVTFRGDPFGSTPTEALHYEPDALVLLRAGRIDAFGSAAALLPGLPADTTIRHYPRGLLVPGFVDCHVHYAQLEMVGSAGRPLLEWLEQFTFPAELAFGDERHAERVAAQFLNELQRNGTTTAAVFATVHPQSVDALFRVAEPTGLRIVAGKCLMDRHAPDGLRDSVQQGYDDSAALITRWHGRGRLGYAITPRFVASSSDAQLEAAGALWRAHPGTLLQSHLSENTAEVEWIRALYPQSRDYVDVFDRFGLLGRGAIHAHGIHLSERERSRLAQTGTALAHCPTSNLFLGSGLFDLQAAVRRDRPIPVGLATDVGAGTTLSMLATMGAAMHVAQLRGTPLAPAQALWLGTAGAARALTLEHRVGNLEVGLDADVVVLDPNATPFIAARTARVRDVHELLGVLMTLGDDRCIRETWADGRSVWIRPS
ncbi:MAG: guanine deaminase [Burkholderiales bacterium]|nr:guanine deaminase [Burkholderiales bacterium]